MSKLGLAQHFDLQESANDSLACTYRLKKQLEGSRREAGDLSLDPAFNKSVSFSAHPAHLQCLHLETKNNTNTSDVAELEGRLTAVSPCKGRFGRKVAVFCSSTAIPFKL